MLERVIKKDPTPSQEMSSCKKIQKEQRRRKNRETAKTETTPQRRNSRNRDSTNGEAAQTDTIQRRNSRNRDHIETEAAETEAAETETAETDTQRSSRDICPLLLLLVFLVLLLLLLVLLLLLLFSMKLSVVKTKPHARFVRDGNHLIHKVPIPLVKALCGFTVPIESLDGRQLKVKVDTIISPKSRKVVPNEGMPISKRPGEKGDLILEFDIHFPKYLGEEQKARIKEVLPSV